MVDERGMFRCAWSENEYHELSKQIYYNIEDRIKMNLYLIDKKDKIEEEEAIIETNKCIHVLHNKDKLQECGHAVVKVLLDKQEDLIRKVQS